MSQQRPTDHEITVYASEYILNGGVQVQAWRKAFPKSKAGAKVQWEKASGFHKLKKVQETMWRNLPDLGYNINV